MPMAADGSRGLASRARVEDALAWIDAHAAALEREDVLVADAAGRVLRQDVLLEVDLPPFDRAAIDGIAVRADETVGASTYNPIVFRLAPDAGNLPAGDAVRLDAGDRLPRGARCDRSPRSCGTARSGDLHDRRAGGCGQRGREGRQPGRAREYLLGAWRRLGPADIGMLAAAGNTRVGVVRRPRVRCVSSGDAIEAGTPLPPAALCDANGTMLRALIDRDGGVLTEQRRAEREREALRAALELPGADLVLLEGGGDHAAAALAAAGGLAIDGVALRPGATAGFGGTKAGVPVLLLPGAPVACLWAYEFFAGRAIRCLGGRSSALPFPSSTMTATRKIVSEIGMTEVVPVQCVNAGAGWRRWRPSPRRGSGPSRRPMVSSWSRKGARC